MKSNALKTLSITLLIASTVTLFGYRVYIVNEQTPPPKISEFQINEEVQFTSDYSGLHYGDVSLKVTNKCLLNMDQLKDWVPNYTDETLASGGANEGAVMAVSAIVTNNTNKVISVPAFLLVASSGSWANAVNPLLLEAINGVDSIEIEIDAFQSKEIVLPFDIYDTQFDKQSWQELGERSFSLVASTYPEKKTVNLGRLYKE